MCLLKAALISLLVNFFASIMLMKDFGVMGLAWANLVAAIFQLFYLSVKNPHISWKSIFSPKRICLQKVMLASLCMYTIVTYCKEYIQFGVSKSSVLSQLFSNFYWFFFLFYHIDSIKFSVKKRKTVAVLQESKIINAMDFRELKMSRKTSGFTLIELMVVIIVIGIVGGIVFGGAGYIFEKQAVKQAEAEVEVLKIALEDYKRENGQYPETFDF